MKFSNFIFIATTASPAFVSAFSYSQWRQVVAPHSASSFRVGPLFDGGNDDQEITSPSSADSVQRSPDDGADQMKEINEAFEPAKARATGASAGAFESSTVRDTAIAMVKERAKEEINGLKFQVGKIDEERVRQLERKEAEMNRLKFSLVELKDQVADSERRAREAEKEIGRIQEDGESLKEENNGILAKIKDQFRREKEDLAKQLDKTSLELELSSAKGKEEVSNIKASAREQEAKLIAKVTYLGTRLSSAEKALIVSTEKITKMREDHRVELRRQNDEARRFQKATNRVSSQDKKKLRRKAWEMQTALDSAKMDLQQAKREMDEARADVAAMEELLRNKEAATLAAIAEAKAALEVRKAETRKYTIDIIAKVKGEMYEALRNAGLKYDKLVASNAKKLEEAKEEIERIRMETKERMKEAKKANEREMSALKESSRIEMLNVRADAEIRVNEIKLKLEAAEEDLVRQEVLIQNYEMERSSFRSLGRRSLKLARIRTTKLKDRMKSQLGKLKRRLARR